MDGGQGAFVLFDDADTLRARLSLLDESGAPYIFAAWEGCEDLFSRL